MKYIRLLLSTYMRIENRRHMVIQRGHEYIVLVPSRIKVKFVGH